ncbi:hypothetical protein MIND_00954300 [Mycena indigotica]|uniref:Uncharacterized protein n=1 Tax=Mycena indigotica TaxID=2126181 RepID=A0A8H6VX86_9AGAR|nr:uncharacterized protein MIND_00954300 [Mycena indigotica]KAF7297212.1 hypothetical protein MIND_00954300 [Mycena indigotica]
MPATISKSLLPRDTPRIGGSTGGFIGLVVGLSVIIVVSCIAIFWLLRHHEPSERDRAVRRERRETTERAFGLPKVTAGGSTRREANASATSAWTSLSQMFKSHNGHGWIQASGDAWEADEAEREMGLQQRRYEDAPFKPPVVDPYNEHAVAPPPTSRASSMLSYPLSDRDYDPEIRWTPRFTASHSTFSDMNTIPRSASPESDHTVLQQQQPMPQGQGQNRHMSADSIRTFEGGTKFVEGL